MSILKQLISKRVYLTTYQIGLLVARTHRTLKAHTDEVLAPYDLTSVDWAIMGLVHDDNGSGIRLSDLSIELGVEAPFITVRIKRLEKRQLVLITQSTHDKRERLVTSTPAGIKIVTTIEPILRTQSRRWLTGANLLDIKGFITTMKTIVKNSD